MARPATDTKTLELLDALESTQPNSSAAGASGPSRDRRRHWKKKTPTGVVPSSHIDHMSNISRSSVTP